jgi:hypothetical protein
MDIYDVDLSFYDQLFENSETNGVKIEYDWGLVDKYVPIPEVGTYDNSYLTFGLEETVLFYDLLKKPRKDEDSNEEEYSTSGFYGNQNYVSKELFLIASSELSDEEGNFDAMQAGTLCKAISRIGKHHKATQWREEYDDDMGESYMDKVIRSKQTLKFLNFLEQYLKSDDSSAEWTSNSESSYIPQKDIKKITIQYGKGKNSGNVEFPYEWFDLFVSTFRKDFNKDSDVNVGQFFHDTKTSCELFLTTYSKTKAKANMILREYASSLDALLKEFKIKSANKRHMIIGNIFKDLKLFPEERHELNSKARFDLKVYKQLYADRVRILIERKK